MLNSDNDISVGKELFCLPNICYMFLLRHSYIIHMPFISCMIAESLRLSLIKATAHSSQAFSHHQIATTILMHCVVTAEINHTFKNLLSIHKHLLTVVMWYLL